MVKHINNKMITECSFKESNKLEWNQIINEINAYSWYDILADKRSHSPKFANQRTP